VGDHGNPVVQEAPWLAFVTKPHVEAQAKLGTYTM
jgi:hypothetical protein